MIKKNKKTFPSTPTPIKDIGKWRVAVDVMERRIYFWDGKSTAFNFYYELRK